MKDVEASQEIDRMEEEEVNYSPQVEEEVFEEEVVIEKPQLDTIETKDSNGHRKSVSITIQTIEPSVDEQSPLGRELREYESKL